MLPPIYPPRSETQQLTMTSTALPFAFSDCEDEVSEGTFKLPDENALFGLGGEAFFQALEPSDLPVPPSDISPAEIKSGGSEISFASSITASGSVEDTSGFGNLDTFTYSDSYSFQDLSVTRISDRQFDTACTSSQASPSIHPTPLLSESFNFASQVQSNFDPVPQISHNFNPSTQGPLELDHISQSSEVSQLPVATTTAEILASLGNPFSDLQFQSAEEAVEGHEVGSTFDTSMVQNAPIYSDVSSSIPKVSTPSSSCKNWLGGVRSRGIARSRRESCFSHMISGPTKSLENTPACLLCNLAFHNASDLKNHRRKYHPKPKIFDCPVPHCSTRFSAKCNLSKHFKSVHEKIRPYFCDEESCVSTFSERNKLKKHRDTVHRGERPFVCEFVECAKPFGQKSDRTRHVSVVHMQQRKYKCGDCVKSFGRKSSLTQHVIRIHKVDKHEARDIMSTAIGDDAEGSDGIIVYPRND